MKIPISLAKEVREQLGLTHLVIFGMAEDGEQLVATHGETERHAREAAQAGNKLKGALGWPENLCKARPLERICANCAFYQADYGVFCVNGWSDPEGRRGKCLVEPHAERVGKEHSCRHFSPNT